MLRYFVVIIAVLTVIAGAGQVVGAPSSSRLTMVVPANVQADSSFAFEFRLPSRAAAVDGRILLDTDVAEIVGLAPVGGGSALAPVEIPGGVAFGAYNLNSSHGRTTMRVVVAPHAEAQLNFRIIIDAIADANGNRIALSGSRAVGSLKMGRAVRSSALPANRARLLPSRSPGAFRAPIADNKIDAKDLDIVRADWALARANDAACGAELYREADANDDGCVDIADIQAVAAAQRSGAATRASDAQPNRANFTAGLGQLPMTAQPAAAAGLTWVVDSTADAVDAINGDNICADNQGRCTLRAAITEANWHSGPDRIEFNLPGSAPVAIQLNSSLPQLFIQDRSGGVEIDGYTQPGSSVNDASVGSNAIPGVELRGNGNSPRSNGIFIVSANNMIRGFLINNFYRGIFVDTTDAHDNLIVGNFFGYTASGAAHSYKAYTGLILDAGANHNFVGTPALRDRNVSTASKGFFLYGPGTEDNVLQNNVLCLTPSGMGAATCSTGIDHDFGVKNNLLGGSGAGERNVIGPSSLQGIELSHGWDPAGTDTSGKWLVSNNRIIGNWVGFRGDGSYNSAFRSGLNNPGSGDNGNGINVYDGSSYNLVEGNWVASVYDGIQTMSSNSTGNIIRNNVIGESPLGQAAPLTRTGIVARLNTRSHTIEGNIVRNAGRYGIGLTQADVLWVRLSRNIITDMTGPAIFLQPNSANPNTGANELLALPVITAVTTIEISGTGIAGATVEAYRASRPAGQNGLPVELLGTTVVATDGTWTVATVLQVGDRATVLQITPDNNTSMLATNVAATFEQPLAAPIAGFSWTQLAGGTGVTFTDLSAGSPASWSWEFGDGITSTEQSPTHTYAAPDDYSVKLTATNAGGSDSVTKIVTVSAPANDLVAADSFARTASAGWGSADVGGPYAVEGTAANYSVDGSAGKMLVPAPGRTRSALLSDVSRANVDVRLKVSVDKVASGGRFFVYAIARRSGGNEYRMQLIFNANDSMSVHASTLTGGSESGLGGPTLVPGLTNTPDAPIWVRTQLTGTNPTTIRIKAWADGEAEPQAWLFTATDSTPSLQSAGAVGLRAYVASSVNNAPVTFSFDDYSVSPTQISTTVASDAFQRSATSSWGSADIGGLYGLQGTTVNYSVADGVGKIVVPAGGLTRSGLLNELAQQAVDIRFRVALDKLPAGGACYVYAVARRNSNNEYRPQLVFNANGTVTVQAGMLVGGSETSLGSPVVVPGLTYSPGTFIWLRAQIAGADPTTIRVKAWADGQPEPSSWQFEATNSAAALQASGSLGMRAYVSGSVTNTPVTISFDDYSVITTE